MGGRGRPRKNQNKTPVIDRGIKENSSKDQGKQHAKGKMQEEELDLDSDSELNWPDLSCNRVKSTIPVSPANQGVLKMNISLVGIGGASTSKANSNETVTTSVLREQSNGTMIIRAEEEKQNQTRPTNFGRSWVGLLHENKLAAKGMDLTYVPPVIQEGEVVVQIQEEDIVEEKQKWNRAIIMYVVGNTPTIGAIERFVAAQWGKIRKSKVLFHSDGYFIILMHSFEERYEVLMNGPYTMNNRPVILKAWAEGFDFNEEVFKTIPLWVKFPKLPLNYWSNMALSKIESGLGKPLYATCTTVADRISYARILIEMDITRTLPGTIKLIDPNGKVIEQMQLAKGKSASKKNGDGRGEKEINTGNAFKALVDTAQRIVQMTGEHDKESELPRDRGRAENSVKEAKAEAVIKKVFNNWRWIENDTNAPCGRIWIAWDKTRVDFECYEVHQQYIIGGLQRCKVVINLGLVLFMVCILYMIGNCYGKIWEKLYIAGITDPYVLIGDYNTILTNEDRVQGTPVQEFEVKDFKEFIWRNGLTKLKTVGRKYTWTNNHVHSKIDRILVNAAWIKKWPVMEGRILQPGFSDHCPLSITMDYERQSGGRPFKFFNCMAQHKEFEDAVYECWRKRGGGTIMNKVWMKLKLLKNKLKQMNRQEFSNTGQRIQAARIKLEEIQEQMDGSGNTKVVEAEILKFYKQLLGTAAVQLPAVSSEVMKQGNNLNRQQQLSLIRAVTKEEVKQALQDIDDNKAPVCDGYNTFFYKKAWHIIGKEVTQAVLEFFENPEMCKQINCTTITLIPKVKTPSNIKEFRPISCCTVLYKIISKILTSRLQEVLTELIDNCQIAFVPDREITDNIIMSH
ncbi:PREDICTED: uncharacterized protein LOC109224325 [Nicotiana attenuata]|uniref:uncharacterized protein LOC109224325 n=1 Tax=Nicotiana attenuata TaxID=49451 RepID=UPI0009053645|nr:PREDICTED: uncharacterized protein LOC109224325 [Nicotiana attenuata]